MEKIDLIKIIGQEQKLIAYANGEVIKNYTIATSKFGFGEERDSYKTPRGWHEIKEKIGKNCPVNTVFVGRKPTGEIYTPELKLRFPNRDWILTRILWLSGLEAGKNLSGNIDTMQRYIYIHGTPDDVVLGVPSSHGCIRMHNEDLIELFDSVSAGAKVVIYSIS